jgi:SPP1 family predicted phage head-tail adaptor
VAKRFPRIGELRQRVIIQSRQDQESGLYSGISTRATTATVWAKIENVTGTQQIDSRNAGATVTHRIWVRWRNDVDVQHEVLYTGKTGETYRYAIQTIQNVGDERERFFLLECLQMAEQNTLDNPSPETV